MHPSNKKRIYPVSYTHLDVYKRQKLKSILYILMLLPFLWSCNNEDDVEEIFASGTWHVVDFYGKANWDKRKDVYKRQTNIHYKASAPYFRIGMNYNFFCKKPYLPGFQMCIRDRRIPSRGKSCSQLFGYSSLQIYWRNKHLYHACSNDE